MRNLLFPISLLLSVPATISAGEMSRVVADTLPEVVVDAAVRGSALTSTMPYHAIDSERAIVTGITDIADALRRVPGVNVRDYGGAGGLKTVSVRGLGAQHTGVTYDGIPLSDMRSGEIDLARYSFDNIVNLTVASGDNAEIFVPARTAASAATVALVSTPAIPDKGNARFGFSSFRGKVRFGSFGNVSPSLRMNFSKAGKALLDISGGYNHGRNDYSFRLENGDSEEKLRRVNSLVNSGHGEINFIWKPVSSTSVSAKLYYYDNNRQLPGPVIYYVNESHERLHDRDFSAQAGVRSRLSRQVSLLVLARHARSHSYYSDRGGIYPGGRVDQRYRQRETYGSASLLWLPAGRFAAVYSADWFLNTLRSSLVSNVNPRRNSLLQSVALKYNLWRLTVTGRLLHSLFDSRADGMRSRHDSRFSPSLSLSVQPAAGTSLFVRAGYKEIFRMPTFNELYFDNYGSVNLEPEYTRQINLGVTFGLREAGPLSRFEATVDAYLNHIDNKIVAIPYSLYRYTMKNLGHVRIAGVDATAEAGVCPAPRQEIVLSGTWSYQRAAPRTSRDMLDWNRQLAYTPLNSGSASLSWLNPWVNAAFHITGASARYMTSENIPTTRIDGYAECGLSLFRDFDLGKCSIDLRADVINLFDTMYEIVARYPMPGRNFMLTVGIKL